MKSRILVLCGGESPPAGKRTEEVCRLNLHGSDPNVVLKVSDISRKLAADIPPQLIDLLELASYIYCADLVNSRGGTTRLDYGSTWDRRFQFIIPVRNPDLWTPEVGQALADALGFVADEHYAFEFVSGRSLPTNVDPYFEFPSDAGIGSSADEVMLFSGGLDSLAGAIKESVIDKRQVALISHRAGGKIAGHQKELVRLIQGVHPSAKLFHVPIWAHQLRLKGREATQRTRSFLYSALAFVVARMYGLNRIRYFENGITSLNLPISEQITGARASRSTHPQTLARFARFFSLLAGSEFAVEAPFSWRTKVDLVNLIGDAGCADLIEASRSCLHVRETSTMVTHCGRCSQCVSRRFATLASRYPDFDRPGRYAADLLTDPRNPGSDLTLLESYTRFATDIREMSELRFFEQYPEFARVAPFLGESADESAQKVLDLHRRHSLEIDRVLEDAIRRNARAIRRGELAPGCLVMLALPRRPIRIRPESACFPAPDGTRWEDVEVRFIDGDTVSISAKGLRKPYSYVEMGMADGRNKRPTKQWDLLREFAYGRGTLTWSDSGADERNQKRREYLSRDLKRFFKMTEDPIHFDPETRGWRTRFRILPDAYDATEISVKHLQ